LLLLLSRQKRCLKEGVFIPRVKSSDAYKKRQNVKNDNLEVMTTWKEQQYGKNDNIIPLK